MRRPLSPKTTTLSKGSGVFHEVVESDGEVEGVAAGEFGFLDGGGGHVEGLGPGVGVDVLHKTTKKEFNTKDTKSTKTHEGGRRKMVHGQDAHATEDDDFYHGWGGASKGVVDERGIAQ